MPIYEYECELCAARFEEIRKVDDRHNARCTKCDGPTKLLIQSSISKDWFRPHWNEHINSDGPVYVESKKQYKQLCKEQGVMARCLL